jgi:hypothetical protein
LSELVEHKIIQDEENNILDFCWSERMNTKITSAASNILETKTYNPFNFLIYPIHHNHLPLQYDELNKNLLFAALKDQLISYLLRDYEISILKASNFNTIPF